MENEGYLLGLDASTTEVGICVWSKSEQVLIKLDHLSLSSEMSLLEKAFYFKSWFDNFIKEYPEINEVVIEQNLEQAGKNTRADILQKLAAFNMSCQIWAKLSNLEVHTIPVSTCRYNAFENFKPARKAAANGADHKTQMFDHVFSILGKEYFPTKILKSGPRKGQEVFEDFCTDMSDAYVVALGFIRNREKEKRKLENVGNKKTRKRKA